MKQKVWIDHPDEKGFRVLVEGEYYPGHVATRYDPPEYASFETERVMIPVKGTAPVEYYPFTDEELERYDELAIEQIELNGIDEE